jgi:2-keto-4-pentenoate hydratase/2-oxohepta-3-ene-1,7-dioic acid hydratase in catechol pathway
MRLATIRDQDREEPAVVIEKRGIARVRDLLPDLTGDLMAVIGSACPSDRTEELAARAEEASADVFADLADVELAPPYRRPRKLWGIGLNYVEHAGDLTEQVPEEPASFLKGDHTVIGPADPIPVPAQSARTTAEAELGLVIGRECRDVSEAEALDYVFGVCPVLDQTAEDILERNPRFLTRAKNFPGFLSFGPQIVTLDEVTARRDLADIEVSTVRNGEPRRMNTVRNMRYSPAYLVSFHSAVMPLFPGDVILTGTPGAVQITPGDVVECRIPGIGTLANPVT